MALVSYNESSDSDSDEASAEPPQAQNSLFAELPAPKLPDELSEPEMIVKPSEKEISLRAKPPPALDAELQVKKKKKQILLPSLHEEVSDDDDDDADQKEARKQKILSSAKGSIDLFGNLPKPKHSSTKAVGRTLLPHVLTKQADSSKDQTSRGSITDSQKTNSLKPSVSSKSAGNTSVKAENSKKAFMLLNADYGSDDEDDKVTNFFSLETDNSGDRVISSTSMNISLAPSVSYCEPKNHPVKSTEAEDKLQSSLDFAVNLPDNSQLVSSTELNTVQHSAHEYVSSYPSSSVQYYEDAWHSNDSTMHDYDALQNPQCTSTDSHQFQMPSIGQKRRRGPEKEIQVIEVNLADHLSNSSLELTKNLTIEQDMRSHSKKRNKDMPTSQQKRKHQITYLAHQAKERELELKNQWAENKFSKKQTQSKYGF